ncbi:aquaporin Z [Herbiconiux sp. UC225_62]|uniref:aquaporin Z n=1 Tax=Herbiconiux sp. UC225_62 TaxID=3350168 RepID=UPI0036D42203
MSYPAAPEPTEPSLAAKLIAEVAGTFLLVFALVGAATFSAVFGGDSNPLGIGFLGVALTLGLTVMIGAYAFGPISGGHFNPAVTLGLAAGGRFAWKDTVGYIVAQLVGGILGATAVFALASGGPEGFLDKAVAGGFVSNGFGQHSPGGFGIGSAIAAEIIITFLFLLVILSVTHVRAVHGFAPIAIGLTLTIMLLVTIPIDNASLNPARSIATAIYGGGDWLAQLWVFIVFPIVGALIAGFVYKFLFDSVKKLPAQN